MFRVSLVALLMLAAWSSPPLSAQDADQKQLLEQIQQLQAQIATLQQEVHGLRQQVAPQGSTPASARPSGIVLPVGEVPADTDSVPPQKDSRPPRPQTSSPDSSEPSPRPSRIEPPAQSVSPSQPAENSRPIARNHSIPSVAPPGTHSGCCVPVCCSIPAAPSHASSRSSISGATFLNAPQAVGRKLVTFSSLPIPVSATTAFAPVTRTTVPVTYQTAATLPVPMVVNSYGVAPAAPLLLQSAAPLTTVASSWPTSAVATSGSVIPQNFVVTSGPWSTAHYRGTQPAYVTPSEEHPYVVNSPAPGTLEFSTPTWTRTLPASSVLPAAHLPGNGVLIFRPSGF